MVLVMVIVVVAIAVVVVLVVVVIIVVVNVIIRILCIYPWEVALLSSNPCQFHTVLLHYLSLTSLL